MICIKVIWKTSTQNIKVKHLLIHLVFYLVQNWLLYRSCFRSQFYNAFVRCERAWCRRLKGFQVAAMVQVKRLTGVRPMRLPEGSFTEPGLPDVPINSTDATLMPRWCLSSSPRTTSWPVQMHLSGFWVWPWIPSSNLVVFYPPSWPRSELVLIWAVVGFAPSQTNSLAGVGCAALS